MTCIRCEQEISDEAAFCSSVERLSARRKAPRDSIFVGPTPTGNWPACVAESPGISTPTRCLFGSHGWS